MNNRVSSSLTRKYLFLYLKTGSGHLAPAKAISQVIECEYSSQANVTLVDGLDGGSEFARFLIEDGYRFLQSNARWYYAVLYFINKFSLPARWTLRVACLFLKPRLRKRIEEEKPDGIVVFHFLLIKPIHEIVQESGLDIPVVTVVTDPFTAHPMWFLTKEQEFVLFSDELRKSSVRRGVPGSQIQVFPFPVSQQFSRKMNAEEIAATKKQYALPEGRKVILIFGGGDGIPRGARILRSLASLKDFSIVVVCGKNQKFYEQALFIRNSTTHQHMTVFGFVDFIYELVSISDVVISKCGASTFKEILLLGKIPIVTDYIWEQEKGNVEFLREHRLGFFEPDLAKLSPLVKRMSDDRALYDSMTVNIANAGLRNGAPDVARWLVEAMSEVVPKGPLRSKDPLGGNAEVFNL